MLDVLPNLRFSLLIFSGFFALFSLGVVVFTARSRAVQQGTYVFGQGQWAAVVALFVFGIVFAFAFALPGPPRPQLTLEQLRSKWFNNYYDQCVSGKAEVSNTLRVDCTILSRQQADVSLGIKPVLAKVVWRSTVRDAAIPASTRTEKYDSYYYGCARSLPGDPSPAKMNYCAKLATQQTATALGVTGK